MKEAIAVAIFATIGNLLQGWDSSVIAGSALYIKKEFNLDSKPTLEGLIIAISLIGATLMATISGPLSDRLGRRRVLIVSPFLFVLSGLVMSWAPNIYVLLVARLLAGFGYGLLTLIPVYISETAPSEIRGTLSTLPEFVLWGGTFLAYCMVFGLSLMKSPSWRLMLGVLSIPSSVCLALMVVYLPESPRWLVSQGRIVDAKRVLQRLRGTTDVSGELALLAEDLGTSFIQDQIKIHGSGEGQSWVAKPVATGRNRIPASQQGRLYQNVHDLMDPLLDTQQNYDEDNHVESIATCEQERGGLEPEPVVIKAAEEVAKGASWKDLLEPGVKRALVVGVGLQVLQQISGVNGISYYGPQIFEQIGIVVLLSNMGMGSASASLFISAITSFLMLPCISISMWLIDISGRRSLLLSTIPILIVSLLLLVVSNTINFGHVLNALISASSIVIYLSFFVMAFGSIPDIICAEIFPTRVRGRCIGLCSSAYWIGNILITYSFPVMLKWIGLAGVIGIYVVACIISWIFVFLRVPETKGMSLEEISELFALETT